MGIALLFAVLFGLLVLGVPVAVALISSSIAYVLIFGLPPVVVLHNMVNGIDSFPLLAVPFFILAGHLMNTGGITKRIFDFAYALVGWLPGGLGHANIGASIIFAGMSGAAVADAGALGNIEIKAMRDAGYDADFSLGITAASSTIGPIIPPSLPMVLVGVIGSISIGQLFAAGLIPGLLIALALAIMVSWTAHKRHYPRDSKLSLRNILHAGKRALFPILTPAIIIGGIITGVFTPTEAAVAAVAYALFLSIGVYRTMTVRRLLRATMDTVETTAAMMLIVGGAAIFAWILTANQAADLFASTLLSFTQDKTIVMLLIMAVVLVIGLFMETAAAITILVPVLLPVAVSVGIDPVHFGLVLILNLMIGLLTPPVGMVLFVLAKVADIEVEDAVRGTMPFMIPLLAVLAILVFVPEFSLWLPTLIYR